MAKPGGDRKVQGQGINVLNPNGGKAKVEAYQIGQKNAPDIEQMKQQLARTAQPRNVTTVNMGRSQVYKPMGAQFKPDTRTGQG